MAAYSEGLWPGLGCRGGGATLPASEGLAAQLEGRWDGKAHHSEKEHLHCSGFSGSSGFESHLVCRTCWPPHREGQALSMAEVPERKIP